jgi:pimeloyl-ACP methyl ester carboxylesterase
MAAHEKAEEADEIDWLAALLGEDGFSDDLGPAADPLAPEALSKALLALAAVTHSGPRMGKVPSTAASHARERELRQDAKEEHTMRVHDESPCSTLLVSFCSLAESGDRQHEFVGTARRAGVSHALFVADPLQAWFLRGHDCSDPFASTLGIVRREIARLQPSKVVCIGASMGGYAACRCGLAIGGQDSSCVSSVVVLAFAPQVFIDPRERATLNLPLMGFDTALDRLLKAACKLHWPLHSLVHLVQHAHCALPTARAREARPRVHLELHVGAQALSDVTEARLLELALAQASEEALPVTAEVTVHASCGHTVAADLRGEGLLDAIVRRHVHPI